MPQNFLYRPKTVPFFPANTATLAGSTQRMLPVAVSAYSAQRVMQTYLSTVSVIAIGGVWLHPVEDVNPRQDLKGALPFQMYRIFTTTFSTPDGDVPYKHGDYFIPNGNLVGLAANTQYPIRGAMPFQDFYELVIERRY